MSKSKVIRRGRFDEKFLENESVKQILNYVREHKYLDAQLRDGYINIYVDGGNVLKISQSNKNGFNPFFDKYYFYNNDNYGKNRIPKTYIEEVCKGKESREKIPANYPTKKEANKIMADLNEKHRLICENLDKENIDEKHIYKFFQEAVELVTKWVEEKKRDERKKQHIISCSNRNFTELNNLVVIDLEFAASTNKPYNETNKIPKFDIIAVDREGQIYCIELKDNHKADKEDSAQNIDAHYNDFISTVGNQHQENDFTIEMSEVVDVKKRLGLLPQEINVNTSLMPQFAIAYSGKNPDDIAKFKSKYGGKYKIVEISQISDTDLRINIYNKIL